MAKRKISLIGLVVVMICVLVFAPVVTAGIYFIHTVSGQLQHTASETVSMYLNEFTDRMMETLRDGVYYLTSDSAAQQMMSSSKPLTQIQILQLEQNFSRAFSLGDSLNPDVVSAIYLIKNDQYVPVYGGNYYLARPADVPDARGLQLRTHAVHALRHHWIRIYDRRFC